MTGREIMKRVELLSVERETAKLRESKPMTKQGCCYGEDCTATTCMNLAGESTCAECVHIKRCASMFGQESTATYCQFFPRRFREPSSTAPAAE
jgi:hypothetical protein